MNAQALGERANAIRVSRIAPIEDAGPDAVSFFFQKRFAPKLPALRASVLVTGEAFVEPIEKGLPELLTRVAVVACADPYGAMAEVSQLFSREPLPPAETFLHPTAVVSKSAKVGKGAWVGPLCVVGDGAEIGDGVRLHAQVFVGENARLGEGCVLFPQVTLYPGVRLGKRVRIHSGSVIGADGFGYAPLVRDGIPVSHRKIQHLGGVSIGDDVEIGSNSCVDRGTFSDTTIGAGAKIDNHVQIAHNCSVGEGAILCGSSGLAGSASVGRFVYIGGGAGIGNQVRVGDYAKIGAYTLVSKDVEPGAEHAGNPMRPLRDHLKLQARLNRMLKKERDA